MNLGLYGLPPSGASTSGPTPTFVGWLSASTTTVPLPGGCLAGDLVLAFASAAQSFPPDIETSGGTYRGGISNGAATVAAGLDTKVLSQADITANQIVFDIHNNYAQVILAVFRGASFARMTTAVNTTGASPPITANSRYLVVGMCANPWNFAPSANGGWTASLVVNTTGASFGVAYVTPPTKGLYTPPGFGGVTPPAANLTVAIRGRSPTKAEL